MRIKAIAIFCAALALACAARAADNERSIRVDFTSQPENATVYVDGKKLGVTPLTTFDLGGGSHHARFELKDYEPVDDFFTLDPESGYEVRNAELYPVKGLLLVTTDPAGCDVSFLDGQSFGATPRLITTLDAKGSYRLQLKKTGYQTQIVEVRFDGRRPKVIDRKMILDSGMLTVTSDPAEAQVMLNGISRGVTPLTISDVPKGRAILIVSKEGYLPETRTLSLNAGDSQNVAVTLEGKPGSLFLTSIPDGARFYVNDNAYGRAPVKIGTIKSGKYRVRAELDGYGVVSRDVTIQHGQEISEEFRLVSVRGRLEIRTTPAGAQVTLDGHIVGTTKASSGGEAEKSDILAVENLDVGEHTLVIRKNGYAEVVKHPVVENSRTAQVSVKMKRVFTPNVKIVTATGEYTGVFVNSTAEGVTIELSMGITRFFPREDIESIDHIYDRAAGKK